MQEFYHVAVHTLSIIEISAIQDQWKILESFLKNILSIHKMAWTSLNNFRVMIQLFTKTTDVTRKLYKMKSNKNKYTPEAFSYTISQIKCQVLISVFIEFDIAVK